ncbi:hypothetical protein [Exiguobacterium algae]|uniref:hypothetical protein n=1 Tax=Exiguobacterium algae TaxID=2751250 RepID=UPI001BEA6B83|nr:hypothetical protein [Exiguobacterium algae]
MRSRVIIYLMIPILIFIGILISPPSEESLKLETATVVSIQELIPYEREFTRQDVLRELTKGEKSATIEEWRLERGARTSYSYILRLKGFEQLIQIDAGAANTRSDGYFAMQSHSPLFESGKPLNIKHPIILFNSEQRLVIGQMDIRVIYEENERLQQWLVTEEEND